MSARLALLLLLVAGCGGGKPVARTRPAPAAETLMAALRARAAAVRGLNLETRTTSWLGGDRVRATVLMLVERGGKLRFEAEVALRGTVATLATDGKTFGLSEAESSTFKLGPACADNVAQLVRIPLDPVAIAAVLLGDAPLGPATRAVAVEWDGVGRQDVLVVENTGGGAAAERLWIGMIPRGGDWDVVSLQGESRGRGRWRVSYEDLQAVGDVRVPGVVRFAEPGKSFDDGVEIKVRDRRMNPTLDESVFHLEAPPGFQIMTLGCPPAAGP